MGVQLFAHNRQAYDAVMAMLATAGKAAVIHPTGTGKSFIAFKWVEAHPDARFVWISPSEYIFKTQIENVTRSDAGYPIGQIKYITYARLMMMTDEEIAALSLYGIVLECVSKFILTEIMQVIYECRQGKQSPGTCVPACRSEWRRDETL